jgi:hypothetical protein
MHDLKITHQGYHMLSALPASFVIYFWHSINGATVFVVDQTDIKTLPHIVYGESKFSLIPWNLRNFY